MIGPASELTCILFSWIDYSWDTILAIQSCLYAEKVYCEFAFGTIKLLFTFEIDAIQNHHLSSRIYVFQSFFYQTLGKLQNLIIGF